MKHAHAWSWHQRCQEPSHYCSLYRFPFTPLLTISQFLSPPCTLCPSTHFWSVFLSPGMLWQDAAVCYTGSYSPSAYYPVRLNTQVGTKGQAWKLQLTSLSTQHNSLTHMKTRVCLCVCNVSAQMHGLTLTCWYIFWKHTHTCTQVLLCRLHGITAWNTTFPLKTLKSVAHRAAPKCCGIRSEKKRHRGV